MRRRSLLIGTGAVLLGGGAAAAMLFGGEGEEVPVRLGPPVLALPLLRITLGGEDRLLVLLRRREEEVPRALSFGAPWRGERLELRGFEAATLRPLFAAPLVSATASMMIARNPNLTAGQVLSILQGSTAEFASGSTCGFGYCGAGRLDAGAAVGSTIPASVDLPPGAVAVVEFYDAAADHYFVSSDPAEIANLDQFGSGRWQRTGHVFYAWSDPSVAPPGVTPRNVCRFYAGPQFQIDSHYFTADPARCAYLLGHPQGMWTLQTNAAFWIEAPDASGACRSGTVPVYAFFNNRRDANQRHTIDLSVRRAMTLSGIDKVHAVMGGFHLAPHQPEYLRQTVAELKAINPDWLIPMHCSGEAFIAVAMQEMAAKVLRSSTGTRYVFA